MKRQRKTTFLAIALTWGVLGLLMMAIVAYALPHDFVAVVLGGGGAALFGVTVFGTRDQQAMLVEHTKILNALRVPTRLVGHKEYFQIYSQLTRALVRLSYHPDDVLAEFARRRLYGMVNETKELSEGKVTFTATESWRAIYEKVLSSPGLQYYRSVAHISHEDYWRDIPGQRSLEGNFRLAKDGLPIERILIVADYYWPPKARLPDKELLAWARQQQTNGISVSLCRESQLASDPDLLSDFGIYGDRATGVQRLDIDAKTLRFELMFDTKSIQLAEDRWERLLVYTTPLTELPQESLI